MPKAMQYSNGSVIYFAGDKDDRIFILQKGRIVLSSIDIETNATVTECIREGEFFGVKSALGHFPRYIIQQNVRFVKQNKKGFRLYNTLYTKFNT